MSKARRFLADWAGWVVVVLVFVAIVIVFTLLVLTGVLQSGLDEYIPSSANAQRAKTLWDWMDLILVPLVLALGAGLFTWVTNRRQRDLEADRSREAALQTYLDRMTELIEKGLAESGPDDPRRSIARARTLTVLRQLDGERKGLLLRFLHESDLIEEEAIVDLSGADLSRALLSGANLGGTSLYRANLSGANLIRVALIRAGLSVANLNEANLSKANLSEADLTDAELNSADLSGADLNGAVLRRANLSGAYLREADLTWANLSGAQVSSEQLGKAASLKGAAMPDDTKHE